MAGSRFARSIAAAAAAVAAAAPAAGQVLISPVVVDMAATGRPAVVSVTLGDKASAPVRLQAQLLAWGQSPDGKAATQPSDDLLVAPRIAELKPGQRQIFRLAWRQRPPARQMAYRLILEEVEAAPATPEQEALGLRFRMRYDLAVLVNPAGKVVTDLRWSGCGGADASCVRLRNAGTHRVKVATIAVTDEGGSREVGFGDGSNILAGAVREVHLAAPARDVRSVRAHTAGGDTIDATPAQE